MRKWLNIMSETYTKGAHWYDWQDWSISRDIPFLYHGTSSALLPKIIEEGMKPPNHWGSEEVARYFAKSTCVDHGGKPIIIRKPMADFTTQLFSVDDNMIDFCIFSDYDIRSEQWEDSDQDWVASLRIYEAVVYDAEVYVETRDLM